MLMTRTVGAMLWVGLTVLGAGEVFSQNFPIKPVHFLTGGAGGGNDFTARQIAQGQQAVVENRTTIQSAEFVAKAPPDGYNLFVGGSSLWIRPLLAGMSWDPVKDFSPVTLTDSVPNVVAVHPSMPVKSVKELIALAKSRPGQINYGTAGVGSSDHLLGELFKSLAGVNIVHVPYKNATLASNALLGGEVGIVFNFAAMSAVKSGKLRALVVTSNKPSTLFPDLPTATAAGLPGFVMENTAMVMAPAKTPDAVIRRLNQEIVRFLTRPEVSKRFLDFGTEVIASSPEELAAYRDADMARISKVIKEAAIKAE